MAPVEYVELGITLYGIAVAHHKWITDWIDVSFRGPPCSQITPESNPCPEGAPARVATLISVERLLDVVAPTYFEVEFYISFSWQDSRISERCTATETDAEPDFQDPCTLFWRPAMNEAWTLPTALLGDEEPQVVEDFGTNRAPPEGRAVICASLHTRLAANRYYVSRRPGQHSRWHFGADGGAAAVVRTDGDAHTRAFPHHHGLPPLPIRQATAQHHDSRDVQRNGGRGALLLDRERHDQGQTPPRCALPFRPHTHMPGLLICDLPPVNPP